MSNLQITAIEAINEFYRLKEKYQDVYYQKYVKPIINSYTSTTEKRAKYSKLPKHKCINCDREVGTIFSIKTNLDDDIKIYSIKCGDVQDPCPLDIEINYSNRIPMDREIREVLSDIDKIKLRIIKEKNNSLFFGKNVIDTFNKLTEILKIDSERAGFIIETNIIRNDNPEKLALLKKKIDEFGKGSILPFKRMVAEFNETNDELIMNQAIMFYINEMLPKLKEIQSLKYDINTIEYDETDNIYRLIQMSKSLESNELFHKMDDKVVKFIKGVRKQQTKKVGVKDVKKNKNKTRKIKPILLEEDEDEDEGKNNDLQNKDAVQNEELN